MPFETSHTQAPAVLLETMLDRFVGAELSTLDAAIAETLERLASYVGVSSAFLLLIDEQDDSHFEVTHAYRHPSVTVAPPPSRLPVSMLAPPLLQGDIVATDDTQDIEPGRPARGMLMRSGVRSMAAAPLRRDGRTIGVVGVQSHWGTHSWTAQECRVLRLVAVAFKAAITRRRDFERQQALTDRVVRAERMESVGRLAGCMAHDFNNTLQAIIASLDMARMHSLQQEQREHLDTAYAAGRRAASLTRQLLAYSRRQPVQERALDWEGCVRRTIDMMRRLLPTEIDIDFEASVDADATVHGDEGQLEQVLVNLLVNARDAIHGRGKIRIKLDEQTVSSNDARAMGVEAGTYLCLSVSDNGCGIEAQHLGHLFEPFFTTKGELRGTGLGLASAMGTAQTHGGSISVKSTVGTGTTFCLWLPRRNAHSAPPPPLSVPSPAMHTTEKPSKQPPTILVAEDDELVRRSVCRLLRRANYTVVEASDGHEALRMYLEAPDAYGLLFLDAVMPGLNGIEVSREVLAHRPHVPIILTSGYTEHAQAVPPSVELLTKPAEPDYLLRRVARALDPARADANASRDDRDTRTSGVRGAIGEDWRGNVDRKGA